MKKQSNSPQIGTFQISDQSVIGQVVLAGAKTAVNLSSNEFFRFAAAEESCIHGVLADNEKISLINCITNRAPGTTSTPNGRSFHANVFPHFVVTGNQHIDPESKNIKAIEFTLENASTLFWDFGTFGSALFADETNTKFLQSLPPRGERNLKLGDHPMIFYFTGKYGVFSCDTVLGRISAEHRPTIQSPSPSGISVMNRIPIRIEFPAPLTFEDAINREYTILTFVEIVMGTGQHITTRTIELETETDEKDRLDVYSTMAPQPTDSPGERSTHPTDVLVNGGIDPEGFSAILASWLARQDDWKDARFRFAQCFRDGNSYTIDRLVAAANLFDILPASAVGPSNKISPKLAAATKESKKLFKALPMSQERESVLGALGRIGKHNLKSKVRHRAKIITTKIGEKFPDLEDVINAAVNTRNYFVHGSAGKLPRSACFEFSVFFTDTLEFIFAASDLVEAGWDIENWASKGSTLSHPFSQYRHGYGEHLKRLKDASS